MTLQLFHTEFPYIWGKFSFLFISVGWINNVEGVYLVSLYLALASYWLEIVRPGEETNKTLCETAATNRLLPWHKQVTDLIKTSRFPHVSVVICFSFDRESREALKNVKDAGHWTYYFVNCTVRTIVCICIVVSWERVVRSVIQQMCCRERRKIFKTDETKNCMSFQEFC